MINGTAVSTPITRNRSSHCQLTSKNGGLDRPKRSKKRCGKDWQSIRVGMSEKKLLDCNDDMILAKDGEGVRLYRTSYGGTWVKVIGGVVKAWASP